MQSNNPSSIFSGELKPELRIAVTTLVQGLMENNIAAMVTEHVERRIQKLEAEARERSKHLVDTKIEQVVTADIKEAYDRHMGGKMQECEQKVNACWQTISQMTKLNTNESIRQQHLQIYNRFETLSAEVRQFKASVNEFFKNAFERGVSESEIKELYIQSGLQLKNFCEKFNISTSTASRYVNGDIVDPTLRSMIRAYLIEEINKKNPNIPSGL